MVWKGILSSPFLYLSLYFKTNRQSYYDHLTIPRQTGNFEKWIEFLIGVVSTSKKVNQTTQRILHLQKSNKEKILGVKRNKAWQLLNLLEKNSIIDKAHIAKLFNIDYKSASLLIEDFLLLGIVKQFSDGNRNKKYLYGLYGYTARRNRKSITRKLFYITTCISKKYTFFYYNHNSNQWSYKS